ncbi:hypothetical protein [Hymenobacter sp.]|uniref:hypothetical protein n=1 Tax=Hymenobacter sp. TaxID=1898978 RepID=UPI00286C53CD|nr:hypothetical protein [Hymenobacter sp.]
MRFFFLAFAVLTLLTGAYWLFDAPGSGAAPACCFFAALAAGTGLYNWIRFGSPLREARRR